MRITVQIPLKIGFNQSRIVIWMKIKMRRAALIMCSWMPSKRRMNADRKRRVAKVILTIIIKRMGVGICKQFMKFIVLERRN